MSEERDVTRWLARQTCRCGAIGTLTATCVGYSVPLQYEATCPACGVRRLFEGFGMPCVNYDKGVTTIPHPRWRK